MVAWFVICLTVSGVAVFIAFDRFCLVTLRWPAPITYYGMMRRCRKLFRLRGWETEPGDGISFDFVARRAGIKLKVTCFPSGAPLGQSTIVDQTAMRSRDSTVLQMLVTADVAAPLIARLAFDERVYILHYSKLNALIQLAEVTVEGVRDIVSMK